MERLTIDVAAADTARRLIEGVAVPYGEDALIGFDTYRFDPGSVTAARARTPLLLGHDLNSPVGILTGLEDGAGGVRAKFRVDRTPDGDRALAQAQSGSRAGLSIGFEIGASEEIDGIRHVREASIYEVSLVSVPAFAGAMVERVAAQREDAMNEDEQAAAEDEEQREDEETEEQEDEEQRADEETETEQEDEEMAPETATHRPVIRAERRRPVLTMRAGEFVQNMIRAERGDVGAQRLIQAALTAVDTSDVPGLLPPAYTSQLLGAIDADRTLANTFRSASPLPGDGMKVTKPKWNSVPNGNWVIDGQATPSSAVAIGSQDAYIEQWAFGVVVSYAALERSTPDFGEAIFREAVADYYADAEVKIHDELIAAMGALSATLGEAVSRFVAARHFRPNVILVSGDIYGDYIDATGDAPLYTTGNVDASGNVSEYIAGLKLVLAPYLNPGTMLVTHTSVIDFREMAPIRVSAQVVGINSVELGVYEFALFDTDMPGAVFPVGAIAPTAVGTDDGVAALYQAEAQQALEQRKEEQATLTGGTREREPSRRKSS